MLAEATTRWCLADMEATLAAFRAGDITYQEAISVISARSMEMDKIQLACWRPWATETGSR